MKKALILLMAVMLFTSCGKEDPEEVTLTKEDYDSLVEAKIENDRLKNEVRFLEQRLEDLTGQKGNGSDGHSTLDGQGNPEATAGDDDELSEALEMAEDKGFTEDEIAAMTLSLYQDSYGYYGFKNADGVVIIEADFDKATGFSKGLSTITSGGKSGTLSDRGVIEWTSIETYERKTLKPKNDVKKDSDFGKFLEEYRQALTDKDQAYVKAHTHPNVKISFGGHSGWSGLVSYWHLDEGSDNFYKMMKSTLQFGAVDTTGGQGNAFTAPYVFTDFPEEYDAFTFSAVIGTDVNIRSRPTTEAEVIGQASYELLKVLAPEKDGWVKIMMPDGSRGYIYSTYIWSPIDYRASFTKVDNTWLLNFFVAGD